MNITIEKDLPLLSSLQAGTFFTIGGNTFVKTTTEQPQYGSFAVNLSVARNSLSYFIEGTKCLVLEMLEYNCGQSYSFGSFGKIPFGKVFYSEREKDFFIKSGEVSALVFDNSKTFKSFSLNETVKIMLDEKTRFKIF